METHPELSVSFPAPGAVEFKVQNRKLRNGRGDGVGDFIIVAFFAWTWSKLELPGYGVHLILWSCAASLCLYFKCTHVLHESIVFLPVHGIQLETHRGLKLPFLPGLTLIASRRFIPLTSVQDVVINEGLRRWDVRYYICVIRDIGSEVTLEVAFENTLPRLPVLEIVYNHIQDLLRDPIPVTNKAPPLPPTSPPNA